MPGRLDDEHRASLSLDRTSQVPPARTVARGTHTIVRLVRRHPPGMIDERDLARGSGIVEAPIPTLVGTPIAPGITEDASMRLNYRKVAPEGLKALSALDEYLRTTALEPALLELVKLRASLMNGCAYCVDLHAKTARSNGETEQRLYALPVWRETPFFSPRERAALAWTEAVTAIGRHGVPDAEYDEVRTHFADKALVDLTLAVITINAWNRLAVTFQPPVGTSMPVAAPMVAPVAT